MDYETIEYRPSEEGIGILSLNRPRKYNTVSYQMMEELEDFWAQKREDLDTAMDLARTMNSKNPMGLWLTKEAINVNLDAGGLEQALKMEDRNQILLVARGLLGQGEKKSRYF